MHIFKNSIQQQIRLLFPLVFLYFLIIAASYFFKFNLNNKGFLYVLIFILLADTLPTIIVHIQYLIANSGAILQINTESKEILYKTSKITVEKPFSDIISFKYYRSYAKRSGWHSFGQYRYYKIIFTDKTKIVITCLLINDIENTLENLLRLSAEKRVRLVCFL